MAIALGWQKAPSELLLLLSFSGVGNSVEYSVISSQSSNVGVCQLYIAGALRKYVRSHIASAVCLGFIGKK